MKINFSTILTGLVIACPLLTKAQTTTHYVSQAIGTAAPFLNFTPDARRAAMGEAGVASSPDANSSFWNIAQLPFAEKEVGATVSYTPWLRDLVSDMAFLHAGIYKKNSKDQVIGLSVNYFDEGQIEFTTPAGQPNGTYHSKEFSITGSIARRLSKNFALGINLRYINSDLIGNAIVSAGTPSRVGTSVAGDIGVYYKKDYMQDKEKEKRSTFTFGAVMSNLGGKITYFSDAYFLPANLKFGAGYTKRMDAHNRFTFLLDFNKLLVPTPPLRDANGNIIAGKDPNRGVINAIFTSFTDAPGGFSQELREVTVSSGAEYWYNDLFAARAGYFFEAESNGGRKYFTTGLGMRFNSYGLDLAYLIPTGNTSSPLANTWRISILFDLGRKAVSNPTPVTPTDDTPDN